MRKPTINFRKLRKHSEIYRKAAELLQYDMETDAFELTGCCSAFEQIANLAWDKVFVFQCFTVEREVMRGNVHTLEDDIEEVMDNFKYMFQPMYKPVYWFGESFSKEEQEHRITSLLLMADIAESEGN